MDSSGAFEEVVLLVFDLFLFGSFHVFTYSSLYSFDPMFFSVCKFFGTQWTRLLYLLLLCQTVGFKSQDPSSNPWYSPIGVAWEHFVRLFCPSIKKLRYKKLLRLTNLLWVLFWSPLFSDDYESSGRMFSSATKTKASEMFFKARNGAPDGNRAFDWSTDRLMSWALLVWRCSSCYSYNHFLPVVSEQSNWKNII